MAEHLLECWSQTVRAAPAARAVVEGAGGRIWSRLALDAAAEDWRATLPPGAGLRGRRVVIAEARAVDWLVVFLGLLKAGAVPVAMDASEPPAGQRAVAQAVRAPWLWSGGKLEPVADAPVEAGTRRLWPRDSRDACLVKLTSGSTGLPKAIPFTHAQMIADGRQVCATMGIGPDDLNLAVIPPGHSYGLGNLVVPLLVQGTALVVAASPLPQAIAADCARWRPTVFPAVPAMLRALAASDIEPAALASLRLVISAGAPLAAEVAQAFAAKFGRRVQGFYGSSETGGICFDRTGEATLTGRSVGTPLEGVRLHGLAGDERAGGGGRGRRFVVESAAVRGRGRFSPADRGRLDERGELVLLGRTGRMVKLAGRRVDLAEVEAALRGVAGVREAFVVVHPQRPDVLAAAVAVSAMVGALAVDPGETRADAPAPSLTPEAVRAALRMRIAGWKVPARVLVLAEFPHTERGKTDTRRLRALLAAAG